MSAKQLPEYGKVVVVGVVGEVRGICVVVGAVVVAQVLPMRYCVIPRTPTVLNGSRLLGLR